MKSFMIGLAVGLSFAATISIAADIYADVTTSGILKDYIVQDANGDEVCRDPMVAPKPFRQELGPEGYIFCQEDPLQETTNTYDGDL